MRENENNEEYIEISLRPKRQITLPFKICEKLGIQYGDKLDIKVEDNCLIAKPKKNISIDALNEIRSAFEKSGISEEGLINAQEKLRHKKTR